MEERDYAFDPQKNAWLIQERGISFDQIIALIESSKLIQVLEHPNAERYPDQLLYEVDVDGYEHVVPVVRRGRILFLKTIPDYALSSAIKAWYKTGTYGCFCGFERWRATRCNFKRG